jgi:hypothetical protein
MRADSGRKAGSMKRAEAIPTLKRGERVLISLHGRMSKTANGWCGDVLTVDAVTIRIEAAGYRFTLDWLHGKGERVIP